MGQNVNADEKQKRSVVEVILLEDGKLPYAYPWSLPVEELAKALREKLGAAGHVFSEEAAYASGAVVSTPLGRRILDRHLLSALRDNRRLEVWTARPPQEERPG